MTKKQLNILQELRETLIDRENQKITEVTIDGENIEILTQKRIFPVEVWENLSIYQQRRTNQMRGRYTMKSCMESFIRLKGKKDWKQILGSAAQVFQERDCIDITIAVVKNHISHWRKKL